MIGWVIFRLENMHDVGVYLSKLFDFNSSFALNTIPSFLFWVLTAFVFSFLTPFKSVIFLLLILLSQESSLFPYTTLFRSLSPRRSRWRTRPPSATACSLERCSGGTDRKSTRLNSSHVESSYAVFCLKKKTFYFFSGYDWMGNFPFRKHA